MKSKVVRIAISGKMCSGKSTLTKYLIEKYGFDEYCFAAKLKEIVKDLFGVETKNRKLLQLVGEKMRQVDSYVWIKYLFNKLPKTKNVIVSDVRYLNEIVTLKNANFKTIRLEVSEDVQRERIKKTYGDLPQEALEHMSEIALDDYDGFDYILDSNQSKEILFEAVDEIIGSLEFEEEV
jgi:dephospho-CoA kinase